MKTKLLLLFTFYCSFFTASQAFAQKDYVILVNGDTVRGKMTKSLFGALKFKASGKAENEKLETNRFKEYFNSKDSSYFVALTLNKQRKPEFLERLENGKIKLYKSVVNYPGTVGARGVMTGGGSTETWYASKDDGELLEIKTSAILSGSRNEREKNFDALMASYPELLEDFKKEKSFSFDTLRAYIKKYNYYYKYMISN